MTQIQIYWSKVVYNYASFAIPDAQNLYCSDYELWSGFREPWRDSLLQQNQKTDGGHEKTFSKKRDTPLMEYTPEGIDKWI